MKKKPSRLRWLSIPLGIAMLVGAVLVLRRELGEYHVSQVIEVLGSIPAWRVGVAFVTTCLGYGALIGHDVIAIQHLRLKVPLRRIALGGFVAYAFSNSSPMSFAVAGTLRLRFYSRWGLESSDIARLVGISLTTYTLGLLTAASFALTAGRLPMPAFLPFHIRDSLPIGLLATAILVGYLVWTLARGKALGAAHHEALGPTVGFTATQIAVSLGDWTMSCMTLYILLSRPVPFFVFFGIFIMGELVSLIAQVPGGLGVLDAVVVLGLSRISPAPATLAALFGYRVIYYLLPLLLAVALMFMTEGKHLLRRNKKR